MTQSEYVITIYWEFENDAMWIYNIPLFIKT